MAARGLSQGEVRGRHTNRGSDWPGVNKTTEGELTAGEGPRYLSLKFKAQGGTNKSINNEPHPIEWGKQQGIRGGLR